MFLALEILHEEFATVEVGVVVVARIPRAVHAGGAAQGVNLQAGVVAHRGQAVAFIAASALRKAFSSKVSPVSSTSKSQPPPAGG